MGDQKHHAEGDGREAESSGERERGTDRAAEEYPNSVADPVGMKTGGDHRAQEAPSAVPAKRCQARVNGLMVESRITIMEMGAQ